jgi:hypothetical protein
MRAATRGCSARGGLAVALGLSALVALPFASSASAADDPLGSVAQGAASAAAPVTNAVAPTATTAATGATETASATTATVQTRTKAVHPPTPPGDRDVSETVRSAGAVVDSAVRTAKRTADSAAATTARVVDSATHPPAPSAAARGAPAGHTQAGQKVEASHARPPSRHPGVTHRTTEPRTSPATAARALDRAPAPSVAAPTTYRNIVSPPATSSRGQRVTGPQPLSPTAPVHGGAAAAGASAAALLLLTFLLAAPAIRRRLLAPSPGHWPAAPVFLLERPG